MWWLLKEPFLTCIVQCQTLRIVDVMTGEVTGSRLSAMLTLMAPHRTVHCHSVALTRCRLALNGDSSLFISFLFALIAESSTIVKVSWNASFSSCAASAYAYWYVSAEWLKLVTFSAGAGCESGSQTAMQDRLQDPLQRGILFRRERKCWDVIVFIRVSLSLYSQKHVDGVLKNFLFEKFRLVFTGYVWTEGHVHCRRRLKNNRIRYVNNLFP